MDFETARMVVLYVGAHELLLEHLEFAAEDDELEPEFEIYTDTVYAVLMDNRGRELILHLLDYSEAEVEHACRNLWESFACI